MEKEYNLEDLEKTLDNLPYGFSLQNSEGKYIYVNNCLANDLQLPKNDILGKSPTDLMGEKDTKIFDGALNTDKNQGKGIFTLMKSKVDDRWYDIYRSIIHSNGKTFIASISNKLDMNMCRVYDNLCYAKEKDLINFSDMIYDNKDIISDIEFRKRVSLFCEDLQYKLNADGVNIYFINDDLTDTDLFVSTNYNFKICETAKNLLLNNPCEYKTCNAHTLFKQCPKNCKLFSEQKNNSNWQLNIYPIKYGNTAVGVMTLYYSDCNNIKFTADYLINTLCDRLSILVKNKNMRLYFEKEFGKSENNHSLFLNTSVGLYLLLKTDGTIINASESCSDTLGFNKNELINNKLQKYIHPDDIEKTIECYNVNNKTNKNNKLNLINRLKCKDGSYKIIHWSYMYNSNDNLLTLTGTDITSQHKLQEENKKIYAELELETAKLEFFSNMSHEFRTPLNIILNSSQLMNMQLKNKEFDKVQTNLKYIRQNSYRLLKLTNNILDTSRIDYGAYDLNFENCNIVEIIENIVTSVVGYVKSFNKNIIFDTDSEEILTSCDISIIERIMLNLLSNAIKYVNDNGNIEVKVSLDKHDNSVLVSVWDDGISISKEDSEKIFQKFNRIDTSLARNYEGGGIGLFLTKSLVELLKGKIWVNTEIDKGAEIVFSIPIKKVYKNMTKLAKPLDTKIEKCNIEFSDIYSLY